MRLLRIAVEKRRWDLAAHTIVLATARVLKNGVKPQASQRADNPFTWDFWRLRCRENNNNWGKRV